MRQLFTFIILSLFSLYGCDRKESVLTDCIESASVLLDEDKPDSAYSVLMDLNDKVSEMTDAERMRYEVCRVSAMNKMFVSLENEEETMRCAVEYYEKNGTPDEKMEACLLLGSVYRDMGDGPQALEWFDKAITHGQKAKGRVTLAKIHGQKADLLIKQRLFEDALVEVDMMKGISQAVGEKSLLVNSLSIKSTIEYCINDYQESVNTYKEASSILCGSLHDTVRAARIATSSIASYMRMERYTDAEELFNFYERHSGLFDDDGYISAGYECYYLEKGDYCLRNGNLQSAIMFYKKGIGARDINNKCMAFYKLANVYSDMSLSDSVAKYALLACGYSQKYFEELQTNTLQQIEATYNYSRYKQESADRTLEAERAKSFTYVIVCIFIVSVGIVFWVWYRWRNKRLQEMEELKLRFERSKAEALMLSASRKELSRLLDEKTAMIEGIQQSESDIGDGKDETELTNLRAEVEELRDALMDAELKCRGILERDGNLVPSILLRLDAEQCVKLNANDWGLLEAHASIIYPSFFMNLSKAMPGIKQEQIHLATLIKLGFTPTQTAMLMCKSVQAVSNARRRMYERAHDGKTGTAELADEWIKSL